MLPKNVTESAFEIKSLFPPAIVLIFSYITFRKCTWTRRTSCWSLSQRSTKTSRARQSSTPRPHGQKPSSRSEFLYLYHASCIVAFTLLTSFQQPLATQLFEILCISLLGTRPTRLWVGWCRSRATHATTSRASTTACGLSSTKVCQVLLRLRAAILVSCLWGTDAIYSCVSFMIEVP